MPFAVNNLPCQDPDLLRQQFGSSLDLLDGCNSYSCPLGDAVGYAYVLMRKDHFDRINGTAFVTLTVRDGYGKAVVLPDLTVVGSAAAYQTDSGTRTGAIVRVTLADRRWRYKMVAVNRQYNFRDAAGGFVAASTNGGTPWTWQGVVDDVWGKLAAALGTGSAGVSATAPLLPSVPSGTPEGFSFFGVDAWAALNRVAQAAGFVLRFDPTTRAAAIVDPNRSADPIPPAPRRTFDDGLWTNPAEWPTTPLVPSAVRVYFPRVQRPDSYSVESATANADVPAGPVGEAWDDMPAVGETVTNTVALAQRAAAVTKLWEYDRISRANPNRMEFQGWQDWVRSNLGHDGWTRWAVYDRGNSPDGIGGGVMTSVNNLTPLRVEYRSGPVLASSSSLTTGNVGDGGAQDSTTTTLRFDDATRIRVTKGATASDPDIVSINGLTATTSGLTIPGTTVAGVVTATRTLPALPRAWAVLNLGTGGGVSIAASGGATITALYSDVGRILVSFAGSPPQFAFAAHCFSNPASSGLIVGGYTTAAGLALQFTVYRESTDTMVYVNPTEVTVTAFW